MPTFSISNSSPTRVGTHSVYMKLLWAADWGDPVPGLYADQVTINAAPSFSTARLYRRYGSGMLPGEFTYSDKTRLSLRNRYFVKIDLSDIATASTPPLEEGADPISYAWVGAMEIDNDRLLGSAGGQQSFVCYGIEHALHLAPILHSRFWDSANEEERDSGHGFIFNEDGKPNRSNARYGGSYLFADDPSDTTNAYWSTRTIIEYLVKRHTPSVILGSGMFRLVDEGNVLPDWDKPVLDSHGRSVWELLNALMSRQRLMSWYVNVNTPDEGADRVEIKPFSLAQTKIDLPDGASFTANASQKTLIFNADPTTEAIVVTSSLDRADQIICRGARRTSTCTLSTQGNEIAIGWTAAQETAYEAGASGDAGYPASTEPAERERRNREARSSDELQDVYRRFTLHDDFYQKCEASTDADRTAGGEPVFLGVSTLLADKHIVPRSKMRILDELVLKSRHDYTGAAIPDESIAITGIGPFENIKPIVVTPLPFDASYYVYVHKTGQVADIEHEKTSTNHEWTARIEVEETGIAVLIDVIGNGMQHVIGGAAFSGLTPAADHGERTINYFDYTDFLFTVSLEDDRFCESMWPETPAALNELVRKRVIDLGDNYRLDYVVADTVVGIEPEDGSLLLTGEGFVQDDRPQLKQIAKLMYAWHGVNRQALEITSGVLSPDLIVGDLVTDVNNGDFTPNSCVTSVQITIPRARGGQSPAAPKVAYSLQFGELDPLKARA